MPRAIQNLLDAIENARYGEQVRSAIHDSIEQCYDDVTAGVDLATAAAEEWTNQTTGYKKQVTDSLSSIASKMADYDDYKSELDALLESWVGPDGVSGYSKTVNDIINSWNNPTTGYKKQVTDALASVGTAFGEWNNSGGYKDQVTAAIASASTAAGQWNDSGGYKDQIDNALSSSNSVNDEWNNATTGYKKQISDIINEWIDQTNGYKKQITDAMNNATNAYTNANAAAALIQNMRADATTVGPYDNVDPTIEDTGGYRYIHFKIPQGPPGASFAILGHVYQTISDLQADILNPSEGDQYNVYRTGTSDPPYDVWRFTGDTTYGSYDGWENDGPIGSSSVSNLTNAEIDQLWSGNSISTNVNKYVNHTGLLHLLKDVIKVALNGKVSIDPNYPNRTLSDNNFTDAYKNQITTNQSGIATNASGIATNASAISANATAILTNTSAISGLSSTKADKTEVAALKNSVITVTLSSTSGSWTNNQQTISNAAFLASGKAYHVEPVYGNNGANRAAFINSNIVALDVTTDGSMTFVCDSAPLVDISVKILCMAVSTS